MIMMQGDDPTTTEVEAKEGIAVVYRSFWSVPLDSEKVYVSIPSDARTVSLDNVYAVPHQGTTFFTAGAFSATKNPEDPPETGREASGDYAGFYYWSFPSGADRMVHHPLTFTSYDDFNDTDENLTERDHWHIEGGNLSLAANVSSASYVSKVYMGGTDISSINVTFQAIDPGSNMTVHVSKDNGTTWSQAGNGTDIEPPGKGTEFRWRVDMVQNVTANNTPVLEELSFDIILVPASTDIWLQATYLMDIPKDGLEFEVMTPFDKESAGLVLLGYFDLDMNVAVTGTEVISTPEATYHGKVTYMHMVGEYSNLISFSVEEQKTDDPGDGDGGNLLLWIVAALLIIGALAVSALSRRGPPPTTDDDDEADGNGPEEHEEEDIDIHELELEKEALVKRIKHLDELLEEGEIDGEEHEAKRTRLKAQAVEVMRRIDELQGD
jgi:hypothetical protein